MPRTGRRAMPKITPKKAATAYSTSADDGDQLGLGCRRLTCVAQQHGEQRKHDRARGRRSVEAVLRRGRRTSLSAVADRGSGDHATRAAARPLRRAARARRVAQRLGELAGRRPRPAGSGWWSQSPWVHGAYAPVRSGGDVTTAREPSPARRHRAVRSAAGAVGEDGGMRIVVLAGGIGGARFLLGRAGVRPARSAPR